MSDQQRDDWTIVNDALRALTGWHEMAPDEYREMYGHRDLATLLREAQEGFRALRRLENRYRE